MRTKLWTMKEGFLIGGCLILIGLALQVSAGPVAWGAFAWPVNGIVLAGFLAVLTVMAYLRKKVYAFQWMTTYTAAIPAMLYAVVLTIIMGLTRQQAGGTWLNDMLTFSTVLALVFICVNLFKPEIHDKTLMPALQSPWFAPHVIVYMFAYAVLGAATVMAVYLLLVKKAAITAEELDITDNMVYVGLAFMTFGMLFGALWAKEAWGHYWSWDPKETWAAITWLSYLIYVHYRQLPRHRERLALWTLVISFALLQMCWWGINYLPSAQGSSVHTYN